MTKPNLPYFTASCSDFATHFFDRGNVSVFTKDTTNTNSERGHRTMKTEAGKEKRAVLVVNKRKVTRKFETCTQLWQILTQAKMWPTKEKEKRHLHI